MYRTVIVRDGPLGSFVVNRPSARVVAVAMRVAAAPERRWRARTSTIAEAIGAPVSFASVPVSVGLVLKPRRRTVPRWPLNRLVSFAARDAAVPFGAPTAPGKPAAVVPTTLIDRATTVVSLPAASAPGPRSRGLRASAHRCSA